MAKRVDVANDRVGVVNSILLNVITEIEQVLDQKHISKCFYSDPMDCHNFDVFADIPFRELDAPELEHGGKTIYFAPAVNEILGGLPDAFRRFNLNTKEVVEVFRRLGRHYDYYLFPEVLAAHFDEIARNDIEGLNLADAYSLTKKLAAEISHGYTYTDVYVSVLEKLSTELTKKIEIEKERLSLRQALSTNYSDLETDQNGAKEYNPTNRGLTKQFAMMLMDELFPNLTTASNTAKSDFLELLTGFSAKALRNKWSDYRLGNPDSIKADMKKVADWKKKLKIIDQSK